MAGVQIQGGRECGRQRGSGTYAECWEEHEMEYVFMCLFEGMAAADKIHINSSHVQASSETPLLLPLLLLTSMLPWLQHCVIQPHQRTPYLICPPPTHPLTPADSLLIVNLPHDAIIVSPVMPVKVEFLMFRVGAVANANPLRSTLLRRGTFVSGSRNIPKK